MFPNNITLAFYLAFLCHFPLASFKPSLWRLLFPKENGEKPYDGDHYIVFAIVNSLVGFVMPLSLPILILLFKRKKA